jgi:hypothetical protein
MRCLSFFINKTNLGGKLCVGTCLKCLTVATPLVLIYSLYYKVIDVTENLTSQ